MNRAARATRGKDIFYRNLGYSAHPTLIIIYSGPWQKCFRRRRNSLYLRDRVAIYHKS